MRALWIGIVSSQGGVLPDPTQYMPPAPHRPGRDLQAVYGLEVRRQRGTMPLYTALALRWQGCFESGTEGAREPRHEDCRLDGAREPTL